MRSRTARSSKSGSERARAGGHGAACAFAMSDNSKMTPAFIGLDWGTTHRRAALISTTGELMEERSDGEGALACRGRFQAALEALLADWPQAQGPLPVVMAGMVGSAIGWQVVPYLDAATPLSDLGRHLVPVDGAP